MSDASLWARWRYRHVDAMLQIQQEVDDELEFHLQSEAADRQAAGVPADQALTEARAQFGSWEEHRAKCVAIAMGEYMKTQVLTAGAIGTLLVMFSFMGWQAVQMRQANLALRQAHAAMERAQIQVARTTAESTAALREAAQPAPTTFGDVAGRVLDESSNPVGEATILLILKTWDGGYRQTDYVTTSKADGSFTLKGKVPIDTRYAVHLCVAAEGHAAQSKYISQRTGALEPLEFVLTPSDPVALQIADAKGQAIAGARGVFHLRRLPSGEEHFAYFQGSDAIMFTTDNDGLAPLNYVKLADSVQLYVAAPGGDWQLCETKIDGSEVTITVTSGDSDGE